MQGRGRSSDDGRQPGLGCPARGAEASDHRHRPGNGRRHGDPAGVELAGAEGRGPHRRAGERHRRPGARERAQARFPGGEARHPRRRRRPETAHPEAGHGGDPRPGRPRGHQLPTARSGSRPAIRARSHRRAGSPLPPRDHPRSAGAAHQRRPRALQGPLHRRAGEGGGPDGRSDLGRKRRRRRRVQHLRGPGSRPGRVPGRLPVDDGRAGDRPQGALPARAPRAAPGDPRVPERLRRPRPRVPREPLRDEVRDARGRRSTTRPPWRP